MTNSFSGGINYQVNTAGSDITNFDLTADRLDFGEISVHGLILGTLLDGTAAIVNPWADSVQTQNLQGLKWADLSLDNFGIVENEHLRQDIGAVLSWEKNIGIRESNTVYVRSHQFGVQEVINDFDPQTQKLSFLYAGTRERLSVIDTEQGLLIRFQPTDQSVLLTGVQRTDLIGANLEFHHDQVVEDNLEVPFGFRAEEVALVSRVGLLTPQAPTGASTDGDQVRAGLMVNPESTVLAMDSSHFMHDHSMHDHAMAGDAMAGDAEVPKGAMAIATATDTSPDLSDLGALQTSISGNLYWGGMSGILTLSNTSEDALKNWSISFLTNQPDFQSWSAESSVNDLGGGSYQVTLTPPAWGLDIPAGESVGLAFNAGSSGLPDSGELTNEMFFVSSNAVAALVPAQLEATSITPPIVVEIPGVFETPAAVESPIVVESPTFSDALPSSEAPVGFRTPLSGKSLPGVEPLPGSETSQELLISATITGGWSGTFAGEITVANVGDISVGTDWRVVFVADAPFKTVSNFEVQSALRSDGRYDISLAAKSWAAPLEPGASQTSYYQAAGDATDVGDVFDFGESVVSITAVEEPSDSAAVELGETQEDIAESTAIIKSPDQVQPSDSGDRPMGSSIGVVEAGTSTFDVQASDGVGEKRIVTYFEEWGVYERDFNLSDVNGQAMTHLNYSFFDVKADGSVQLFDSYAAQEKRFDAADQVSRTFTTVDYQSMDSALIEAYNSDRYTISETADSITVTSVPVGWNDVGPKNAGNFEQLRRFKELNPSVNLGFALGGWTLSDEFSTAFASQEGRDRFTADVVDIFQTYKFFNTVDFDWEYPGGGGEAGNASSLEDGANFALVLEQLRGKLDVLESQTGDNYEVSIATAGGTEKLARLNLKGIDSYVDFYNVMTYDYHGGWENYTGHQAAMTGDLKNYDVTSAVSVFEEAGVELSKVVLGAPAYTRAWGGVEDGGTFGYQQLGTGAEAQGSFEAGIYDYKDMVADVITGKTDLYWDDNSKAAFVYDGDEWSSFETTATIAGKAAYVQDKDLGGMMFWALSNDAEGDLSLIQAANDVLRQGESFVDVADKAPGFDYIFGGDKKFSLNDFTSLV